MVKYNSQSLDHVFASLALPIRRDILARIAKQPLTAGAIASPYRVSSPAISKHLKILEESHLINRTKVGRMHYFTINPTAINDAEAYLTQYKQYWSGALDRLSQHLKRHESDA